MYYFQVPSVANRINQFKLRGSNQVIIYNEFFYEGYDHINNVYHHRLAIPNYFSAFISIKNMKKNVKITQIQTLFDNNEWSLIE